MQLEKAPSPILVMELGRVTEIRPLQSENACTPMAVTECGIVTEVTTPVMQKQKVLYQMGKLQIVRLPNGEIRKELKN